MDKLTGNEHFILRGKPLAANVLGFWQWSSSDLLMNTMRGMLAEYIVALACGIDLSGEHRVE